MSYLHYLCLFTNSGVQHILLCAFVFFLRLVCRMLPVSLDCPLLIAPSVFSNVYLLAYNVLTRFFTFTNVTPISINFKAMFTVHGTHNVWTD